LIVILSNTIKYKREVQLVIIRPDEFYDTSISLIFIGKTKENRKNNIKSNEGKKISKT